MLGKNACGIDGIDCVAETGKGYVGLSVTSLRTSSRTTSDENLPVYQARYSGSLILRKLKDNEFCTLN